MHGATTKTKRSNAYTTENTTMTLKPLAIAIGMSLTFAGPVLAGHAQDGEVDAQDNNYAEHELNSLQEYIASIPAGENSELLKDAKDFLVYGFREDTEGEVERGKGKGWGHYKFDRDGDDRHYDEELDDNPADSEHGDFHDVNADNPGGKDENHNGATAGMDKGNGNGHAKDKGGKGHSKKGEDSSRVELGAMDLIPWGAWSDEGAALADLEGAPLVACGESNRCYDDRHRFDPGPNEEFVTEYRGHAIEVVTDAAIDVVDILSNSQP